MEGVGVVFAEAGGGGGGGDGRGKAYPPQSRAPIKPVRRDAAGAAPVDAGGHEGGEAKSAPRGRPSPGSSVPRHETEASSSNCTEGSAWAGREGRASGRERDAGTGGGGAAGQPGLESRAAEGDAGVEDLADESGGAIWMEFQERVDGAGGGLRMGGGRDGEGGGEGK